MFSGSWDEMLNNTEWLKLDGRSRDVGEHRNFEQGQGAAAS
jgi:hypothetical protein